MSEEAVTHPPSTIYTTGGGGSRRRVGGVGVFGQIPEGVFMDQFETPANFNAHFHGTGPEVRVMGLSCGG